MHEWKQYSIIIAVIIISNINSWSSNIFSAPELFFPTLIFTEQTIETVRRAKRSAEIGARKHVRSVCTYIYVPPIWCDGMKWMLKQHHPHHHRQPHSQHHQEQKGRKDILFTKSIESKPPSLYANVPAQDGLFSQFRNRNQTVPKRKSVFSFQFFSSLAP